jgi:cysteinyl-tRNA synthetase
MANVWMHNGFLQVEGQKMSKSLGNFVTIADVLKDWPGEVARFNMLRTHYRQPIDWTVSSLEESRSVLVNWKDMIEGDYSVSAPDKEFVEALSDDVNTHAAFTRLHALAKAKQKSTLHSSLMLFGLDLEKAKLSKMFNVSVTESLSLTDGVQVGIVSREVVVDLINDRLVARHTKNWKESDRIRDELDAMGIAIKDNKDGTTTWDVKR